MKPETQDVWKRSVFRPLKLCRNRVWRTYTGGKLLDRWQNGAEAPDGHFPEEWIASLVAARNPDRAPAADKASIGAPSTASAAAESRDDGVPEGLSLVESEAGPPIPLKTLIERDPEAMLGSRYAAERSGPPVDLLVKVLDSAERLTIQTHPDRETAQRLFGSPFGKTEAWYILATREIEGERPYVLAGFKPGVTRERWEELFASQDIDGMTRALHRFDVTPGQVMLIRGGLPHAIGPGCLLVELQEPTDLTLRVERTTPSGLKLSDASCHQGAGFDGMFDCFHYETSAKEEAASRLFLEPTLEERQTGGIRRELIGSAHTPYFGMEEWDVTEEMRLSSEDAYSVLIAVEGGGALDWDGGSMPIRQGDTFFLPAGLRELAFRAVSGGLRLIRCLPPRR